MTEAQAIIIGLQIAAIIISLVNMFLIIAYNTRKIDKTLKKYELPYRAEKVKDKYFYKKRGEKKYE